MTGLEDLRATLISHVPVEDGALCDRLPAVRSRIVMVRRRRRATALAGVVAAVAVVAGALALPPLLTDGPDRGDRLTAARAVTVGGFEYRLVEVRQTRPGQDALDLVLPRSGRDQAVVLLADHLGGGTVTLARQAGEAGTGTPDPTDVVDRVVADGAAAPVPVPAASGEPDGGYVLRVADGAPRARAAVALYRRTDVMPDGVVDPTGRTVFRRHVADRTLLGAAFVPRGGAEATVRFTGALADVRLSDFCSVPDGARSSQDRAWLHVSIDGDGYLGSSCGAPAEDATGWSSAPDDHEVREHTVRVWASRTEGGAPEAVPGAVVGVGVYGHAATVRVHGSTLDEVVEYDGRRWRLDRVIDSAPGGHRISATFGGEREPVLVGYAVQGTRRVDVGGGALAGGSRDMSADGLADARSSSLAGVLRPGSEATFTVAWPARYAEASGAVLVYRPAD